ncbi:MAG: UPF0149 family protein [Pseudomonadota bacterium]
MDWDETDAVDPEVMANLLWDAGLELSPSQVHGCLTGLLAAGAAPGAESALASVTRVLDADLFGELAGQVMDLYRIIANQLEDEDFDFYPLLPDDEVEIATRTTAMAGWCQSFLAGFAERSGGRGGLPEDSGEVLGDFAAIAEAVVDDDDSEDDNELEASYLELVEYLRFAALNVYLDSRVEARTDEEPPSLH